MCKCNVLENICCFPLVQQWYERDLIITAFARLTTPISRLLIRTHIRTLNPFTFIWAYSKTYTHINITETCLHSFIQLRRRGERECVCVCSEAIMNQGWCGPCQPAQPYAYAIKNNAKWILLDICGIRIHSRAYTPPYFLDSSLLCFSV